MLQNSIELLKDIGPWDHGYLYPIRINAKNYAENIESIGSEASILNYIRDSLIQKGMECYWKEIFYEIENRTEKCVLLFDGLDEIYSESTRAEVIKSINRFVNEYRSSNFLLTSRLYLSMQIEQELPSFKSVTIASLNEDQINNYVWYWYNLFENRGKFNEAIKIKLFNTIKAKLSFELSDLAKNPLLLTTVLLYHIFSKTTEFSRIDLYENIVKVMLYNWNGKKDLAFAKSEFINYDNKKYFESALYALAYGFQSKELLENIPELSLGEIYDITSDYLGDDIGKIKEFLRFLAKRIGLLDKKEKYLFLYPPIQRYLSACHLVANESDYPFRATELLINYPEKFEEIFRLSAGYSAMNSQVGLSLSSVNAIYTIGINYSDYCTGRNFLLQKISAESIIEMAQIGKKPSNMVEKIVVECIKEWLRSSNINQETILIKEKSFLGELLFQIDDPRNLKDFIEMEDSCLQQRLGVAKNYKLAMSKYLVTNSWFDEFIEDGGYENLEYWSHHGQKWLSWNRTKQPKIFDIENIYKEDWPVVGVSWYEANAFANWLTAKTSNDCIFRLPTENEWQMAASNFGRTIYPWGNIFQIENCNADNEIRRPTSVGVFNSGISEIGFQDLAGNVWEWTCTGYHGKRYCADFVFDYNIESIIREVEKSEGERQEFVRLFYPEILRYASETDYFYLKEIQNYMGPYGCSLFSEFSPLNLENLLRNRYIEIPVIKGGCYNSSEEECQAEYREPDSPNYRLRYTGFRLVKIER